MNCQNCHEDYDDSFLFCPHCGMKKKTEDLRKCPYCAEWIKAKAIKCRYCGELLEDKPQATDSERTKTELSGETEPAEQETGKDKAQQINISGGFVSPHRWQKKRYKADDLKVTLKKEDAPLLTSSEQPETGDKEIPGTPRLTTKAQGSIQTFEDIAKDRKLYIGAIIMVFVVGIGMGLIRASIIESGGLSQDSADTFQMISTFVGVIMLAALIYATIRLGKAIQLTGKEWATVFGLMFLCFILSIWLMLSESKSPKLQKRLHVCPSCGNVTNAKAKWCDKCGEELPIEG